MVNQGEEKGSIEENEKLPELTNREKHIRECYVVLEENADKDEVQEKIKSMKN